MSECLLFCSDPLAHEAMKVSKAGLSAANFFVSHVLTLHIPPQKPKPAMIPPHTANLKWATFFSTFQIQSVLFQICRIYCF